MQSKDAIAIVHVMAGMCSIHNYIYVIWNTDVRHALEYSMLHFRREHRGCVISSLIPNGYCLMCL